MLRVKRVSFCNKAGGVTRVQEYTVKDKLDLSLIRSEVSLIEHISVTWEPDVSPNICNIEEYIKESG